MQLPRFLSVFFAAAIMMIVGALTAPAFAHKGHSHSLPAQSLQAKSLQAQPLQVLEELVPAPQVAPAGMDLAGPVGHAEAAVFSGGEDGPANEGKAPCNGHCCLLSASFCCGFLPPPSLQSMVFAFLSELGSPPPGDRVRDGLAPDSLLRPPQSLI